MLTTTSSVASVCILVHVRDVQYSTSTPSGGEQTRVLRPRSGLTCVGLVSMLKLKLFYKSRESE